MESAQAQQNQPVPADSLRRNQTTAREAMRLEDGHSAKRRCVKNFLPHTTLVKSPSLSTEPGVERPSTPSSSPSQAQELDVDLGDEMVDETHERTKNTNLLLALLKQAMGMQPDPKVVVMSATVDLIIFISPRETIPDCRKAMIKAVAGVAQTKPEGNILVFMTSVQQIEETCGLIRKKVPGLQVLPLYSSLSRAQMEGVVDTNTSRKCSVSINVAEASLTIGGITFMIGNER
ncbi:hypothetical protein CEP53_003914 [Fusarium sp. AF-6]|nr:hypothetical protein CEP53_003914 [Fusarium sp. AF-6]